MPASLFDKAGQDRQKLHGWSLSPDSPVSAFQNRWVVVLQVEHPFEIVYVGLHEDLCT